MPPQNAAKSLMKEFRASFRRKKSAEPIPKVDKAKELEEEELAKLFELKENLGDDLPPQYSDAALLGFLRARSLNVKEAEKLMKLDVNVLRFLRIHEYELPEINRTYGMSGIIGYDNEGSLVRVVNVGDGDFKGIVHSVSTIDEFRFFIWFFYKDGERLKAENKKTGRKNSQFVYILNFERLSIGQVTYKPALDTGIIALKLLQDHYHDIAKAIYIINTPPFFSSVYKLIKPVIQDSLNKRMKIYGYDGWKEELLKTIDPDILPAYLGGNRVGKDGDPNCTDIISFGGTIPEHFYSDNFLDLKDPDVVTATVGAGSTLNFRFAVPDVGTVFRYHIQAKDNDIGIGLFCESPVTGELEPLKIQAKKKKDKDEDTSHFQALTPIIRSQCHICPEVGSTFLWTTGNLILHFDNTYSWMTSKDVAFKIILEPPSEVDKNYVNATHHTSKAFQDLKI